MRKLAKIICVGLCVILFGSCGTSQTTMMASTSRTVDIYFIDKELFRLVPLEVGVKDMSVQKTAEFVVKQLIEGRDDNPKIRRILPSTKGCIDVSVKDGAAYVDLSDEVVKTHPGGRELEVLTVYQIVNSLTSVEGIEAVRFTIDGKSQEDFKGFIDMRETFLPDYMDLY